MRTTLSILFAGSLWMSVTAWAEPATVLAATATSGTAQSTAIGCLLQAECQGFWAPGSADSGANEGISIQFETPVAVDTVLLITNDGTRNAPLVLSINGAPATQASPPTSVDDHSRNAYAVRYPIPDSRVASVFFRLGVRKGGWKHFALYSIRFYRQGRRVDLRAPVLAPATVSASSQLEPRVAYQPANLFDSRADSAWSTDGRTAKGPGESLEIRFAAPQSISGMIVWNGYQRSDAHYSANGRVARLTVATDQGSQEAALADKAGAQRIALSVPLKNVSVLRLIIAAIDPGAKYKDVLISELRFIDDRGRIVLPKVESSIPAPSAPTARIVGRSFSSVVCGSSVTDGDFHRSLRLRRDGSFVIYAKAHDESGKKTDLVLEGNWDQIGADVRIFGRRYAETVLRTEYSETKTRVPASIFQSDLRIARFRELDPREKQQLVALIWANIRGQSAIRDGGALDVVGTDGKVLARGDNESALLGSLAAALERLNPWTFQSPILADAMLPSDEIGACGASF